MTDPARGWEAEAQLVIEQGLQILRVEHGRIVAPPAFAWFIQSALQAAHDAGVAQERAHQEAVRVHEFRRLTDELAALRAPSAPSEGG